MRGNNQFNHPYTKEQEAYLLSFKDSGLPYIQIAKLFNSKFNENKTKGSILLKCKSLGFAQRVKTPQKLNNEQIEWLKENQYGISRKELTKKFNERFQTHINEQQLKSSCNLRGMHNGLTGKFGTRPDWKPWNIGLSKEEFYSHYGGKENLLKNTKAMIKSNIKHHLGEVFIYHNAPYKVVKEPNGKDNYLCRIVILGRYIYEEHYGKIPNGYKIIYKDGNPFNCDIDNLLCVSNKTIIRLAKIDGFGKGKITEAEVELSSLEDVINEFKKEKEK